MSDRKVLSINPDLFSFSNTTKKKKKTEKTESERIKIKPSSGIKNRDTLRKKSILRMIRQHQSERNKENFTSYEKQREPSDSINNDFETAKKFFDNMPVNTDKNASRNHTIKNNHIVQSNPAYNNNLTDLSSVITNNIQNNEAISIKQRNELPIPHYGCLKNGSLPTYRNYMNQTRKNLDTGLVIPETAEQSSLPNNILYSGGGNAAQTANILSQTTDKLKNLKKKRRHYRKKTVKRTFKLGKSKIKPSISVLITNKTVRNKITESQQLLKQTPIPEIRSYLVKHGFIKIGSVTPNDVLRKMYETALLICGEVKNHNTETLMYNFMNNKDDL